MKILIIEDEPSLQELMARSLAKEQHVVETASNYAEAESRLADYSYDCVLLDIMLPDGNGLRLLGELKAQDRREAVIIISARDSLEDKIRGWRTAPTTTCPSPSTSPSSPPASAAWPAGPGAEDAGASPWAT